MKTTIAIKLEINAPCAESKKAMLEWAFRCFRMEYDRFFIGEGHRDYRGKMDLGGSEVHTSADGKLKHEIPNLATSEGSIDVTEVLGKSEQAAVEAGEATGDTSSDRPPLGLRPKAIANKEFNGQRVEEIRQAMGRYIAAGKEFPSEWIQELHLRTAPERAFVLSSNGDYMHGKLFNGAFQAIEKATP